MTKKSHLAILILFSISCTMSCRRQIEDVNDTQPDHSIVECDFNSIQDIIDQAYSGNNTGCSSLTYRAAADSLPYFGIDYKIIDVTYRCISDSTINAGLLKIFYTGQRGGIAFADSVVFDDFKFGQRILKGYRTIKPGSNNNDISRSYLVKNVSQVEFEDGKKVSVVQIRTQKKFNMGDLFNQYIEVSGYGYGLNKYGDSVNHEILKPLVLKNVCGDKFRYPAQGIVQYNNISNGISRTLDYGDGSCDRVAYTSTSTGKQRKVFLK